MRRLDELAAAFTLLTRLPAARLIGARAWPEPAAAIWAYPVAGALVGALAGLVLLAAGRLQLPAGVASILAVLATMLLTGGLHEDGLADTADGFGGGATPARRLEIMRDSRIGSYGALALIVALALRTMALTGTGLGFAALLAAGGLSRGAILVLLLLLRPARSDGSAAPLGHRRPGVAIAGLVLAAFSAALLPPARAALCILGAVAAAGGLALLARRRVGGYTGDVLGAGCVAADCAVLCIAAAG